MGLDDLTAAQPPSVFRPGGMSMHDVAAALHQRRKRHGLAKYATPLQAGNGRSSGIDRLQESLDGLVYDLQVVCEQVALEQALADYRERLALQVGRTTDVKPEQVLALYDALLSPTVLAQRADLVAQWFIAQAAEEARTPLTRDDMPVPDCAGTGPAREHYEGGVA